MKSLLIACMFAVLLTVPQRVGAVCCEGSILDDPGNIHTAKSPAELDWFGRVILPDGFAPAGDITFAIIVKDAAIFSDTIKAADVKKNGPGYLLVKKGRPGIWRYEIKPHNKGWRVALSATSDGLSKAGETMLIALTLNGKTYCVTTIWRTTQSPVGWQEVDMIEATGGK